MPVGHCICAALVALAASVPVAGAQQAAPPPLLAGPGTQGFTIFLRGVQVGVEQISVTRTADGWTILSTGRIGIPLDVTVRRLEVRYTADWKPVDFTIDATVRGQPQAIHTTFDGTTAKNDITAAGQTTSKSDPIEPGAIILPNALFAPYEALSARLRTASPDSTLPVYILPQASLTLRVVDSATEQIQTARRLIVARRTHVTISSAAPSTPNPPLDMNIWGDENGRLLRVTVPGQNLDVAREDIASVAARQVTISRPNDELVRILSNGFSLAGTLSRPDAASAVPRPAVVLTGGSGPVDRDGLAFGIPVLGELAGALADAGFIVVRYDRRGAGQSGGRPETASFADFSEDQRAAVRFLSGRKDVDPKRIAVVGYSEGGLVSLLSGAKEKRIAAIVLIASPGIRGSELVLAQQQHVLSRTNATDAEKQAKIDLQKRINEAAISGKGLDALSPDIRRQIDNAEFQSLLNTDPATIVPAVRQPILIVQGELDTQVAPENADRLAALARSRKQSAPADVVKVPGVNHLLVPATTGEADEYATLTNTHISPAVSTAVVEWLKKTLK
jgi:alpha-beta hydrolase superfamily lysophospholipase